MSDCYDSGRQAGADLEITEAMIAAGEARLETAIDALPSRELVVAVYTAMASAAAREPLSATA